MKRTFILILMLAAMISPAWATHDETHVVYEPPFAPATSYSWGGCAATLPPCSVTHRPDGLTVVAELDTGREGEVTRPRLPVYGWPEDAGVRAGVSAGGPLPENLTSIRIVTTIAHTFQTRVKGEGAAEPATVRLFASATCGARRCATDDVATVPTGSGTTNLELTLGSPEEPIGNQIDIRVQGFAAVLMGSETMLEQSVTTPPVPRVCHPLISRFCIPEGPRTFRASVQREQGFARAELSLATQTIEVFGNA